MIQEFAYLQAFCAPIETSVDRIEPAQGIDDAQHSVYEILWFGLTSTVLNVSVHGSDPADGLATLWECFPSPSGPRKWRAPTVGPFRQ
jgi:hypothetical protein